MKHDPDIYLLYEYGDKLPFTVRMKVILDAPVDEALLMEAAQEAIGRFPYFSVKVGLDEHITGFYTLTDGDLMLEVSALKDKFCISFQLVNKDRKPVELFCELLDQEGVPYSVSERYVRHMPKVELP